jgi:hypothetical protein
MLSHMKSLGFLGVLPKPYLSHELLSTVKAAITRSSADILNTQSGAG